MVRHNWQAIRQSEQSHKATLIARSGGMGCYANDAVNSVFGRFVGLSALRSTLKAQPETKRDGLPGLGNVRVNDETVYTLTSNRFHALVKNQEGETG